MINQKLLPNHLSRQSLENFRIISHPKRWSAREATEVILSSDIGLICNAKFKFHAMISRWYVSLLFNTSNCLPKQKVSPASLSTVLNSMLHHCNMLYVGWAEVRRFCMRNSFRSAVARNLIQRWFKWLKNGAHILSVSFLRGFESCYHRIRRKFEWKDLKGAKSPLYLLGTPIFCSHSPPFSPKLIESQASLVHSNLESILNLPGAI